MPPYNFITTLVSGRENLELIAFIFIGVIMGMANVYIMFQSVARIITLEVREKGETNER